MYHASIFILLLSCSSRKESPTHLSLEEAKKSAGYMAGKVVYEQKCIVCHKGDGLGSPGVFPPLKGSPWIDREATLLASILTRGLGGEISVSGAIYRSAMPPQELTVQQTFDVITYIRYEFAENTDPFSIEEIEGVHKKGGGTIYGEAELNSLYPSAK